MAACSRMQQEFVVTAIWGRVAAGAAPQRTRLGAVGSIARFLCGETDRTQEGQRHCCWVEVLYVDLLGEAESESSTRIKPVCLQYLQPGRTVPESTHSSLI